MGSGGGGGERGSGGFRGGLGGNGEGGGGGMQRTGEVRVAAGSEAGWVAGARTHLWQRGLHRLEALEEALPVELRVGEVLRLFTAAAREQRLASLPLLLLRAPPPLGRG